MYKLTKHTSLAGNAFKNKTKLTQRDIDIFLEEKNTITMDLGVKTGKKDINFVDLVCIFLYYFDILVHTNYFNGTV